MFFGHKACFFMPRFVSLLIRRGMITKAVFKVCLIIIVSNSGADNSASRHDSLNLKGSAESGEKND